MDTDVLIEEIRFFIKMVFMVIFVLVLAKIRLYYNVYSFPVQQSFLKKIVTVWLLLVTFKIFQEKSE